MNAAVVRRKYKKTELDKAVKDYKETVLPAIAKHEGARSAMLLLNRETGDALSNAMYENEAAAQSFAPTAAKLIESNKKYMATDTAPNRELFDIAASNLIEPKATVENGHRASHAKEHEGRAR